MIRIPLSALQENSSVAKFRPGIKTKLLSARYDFKLSLILPICPSAANLQQILLLVVVRARFGSVRWPQRPRDNRFLYGKVSRENQNCAMRELWLEVGDGVMG